MRRGRPVPAAQERTDKPDSSSSKTACCTAQSYQRRGAMHSGSLEQVRVQGWQKYRSTGTGLSEARACASRSALRQ